MYNRQLDTFLIIAECGSFSLAAKQLFITPSAVVQKMNMFEKQLGVQLFQRTKQGVTLTPAGEILRQEAPRMILLSNEIISRMQAAIYPKVIRLGWKTEVEASTFFACVTAFRHIHPNIELTILNLRGEVLSAIKNQELDICQYLNSPLYEKYGYTFQPVFQTRQCIVLAENHPLAGHSCITMEDLKDQPLILLERGILADHDAFHRLVEQTERNIQLLPRSSYGEDTQKECFRNNYPFLGVEALRHWYSPLRCIPTAWDIPVDIGLVYRSNPWPGLKMLVEYLSDTAKNIFPDCLQ